MEGENFESTSANVESTPVETGSYDGGTSASYEESSGYDSSSSADYGSEGGAEGYESSEGQSETIASATSAEGHNFELYTDPITGKTEFRVTNPNAEEDEQSFEGEYEDNQQYDNKQQYDNPQQYNEPQNEQQYAPQQYELPKYSLDEFSYALASGNVDESRIPAEFQSQYANFRIEQAKSAYNQRLAAEEYQRQLIAQQMQIEQSPEARVEANKNFYENLEAEATNLALNDLGLTREALEDLEYADDAERVKANLENAKAWHKKQLMDQLQGRYAQEQAYKAQQQQIYQEVSDYTAHMAQTEPHFAEIDGMLATAWQNMPTKYGTVVKNALSSLANGTVTRQQCAVIQKYFEDTRRLFYAQRNGLSTTPQRRKPPVVERAGNGQRQLSNTAPDYKALRNADARGKNDWFNKYFANIDL